MLFLQIWVSKVVIRVLDLADGIIEIVRTLAQSSSLLAVLEFKDKILFFFSIQEVDQSENALNFIRLFENGTFPFCMSTHLTNAVLT